MSDAADILVVASDDHPGLIVAAGKLASQLGDGRAVAQGCPYEALTDMRDKGWSAIVVLAGNRGFEDFCRASRRLQPKAQLLGLCRPAEEPNVRQLVGAVLDDYFIYPPTLADIRAIRQATSRPVSTAAVSAATDGVLANLPALLKAACTTGSLEQHLAETISAHLGAAVEWIDADQAPPDVTPLLHTGGRRPRALISCVPVVTPDEDTLRRLGGVQKLLPTLESIAQRTESLQRLAITDHLTGAYNRRYFYHLTNKVLQRARREDLRVTMLLYDIDNFKRYNDIYGHAAGDDVLRETAALMKHITRSHDIVARIGGDEFAVLFWDPSPPRQAGSSPPETAYAVAERFRSAIVEHEFPSLGPEATGVLTISGGLALFTGRQRDCRDLLRIADRALREAKTSGKNSVHLIGGE